MGDGDEEAAAAAEAYEPNKATAWFAAILYIVAAVCFAMSLAHSDYLETAVKPDGEYVYPEPDFTDELARGVAFVSEISAIGLAVLLAVNHGTHSRRLNSAAEGPYKDKADKMDRWHHAHPTCGCSGSPTLFYLLQFTLAVLAIAIAIALGALSAGNEPRNGLYIGLGGVGAILAALLLECCIFRRTDKGRQFGPRWQDDQRKKIWVSRAFEFRRPKKASAAEENSEEGKEEAEEEKAEEEAKKEEPAVGKKPETKSTPAPAQPKHHEVWASTEHTGFHEWHHNHYSNGDIFTYYIFWPPNATYYCYRVVIDKEGHRKHYASHAKAGETFHDEHEVKDMGHPVLVNAWYRNELAQAHGPVV